uniref:Uncharacterized protein n=1 Tax=Oryza sativa subsp. japonica TaxID=39947 RepID=Q2QTL7_ORYSJ|nr:hypothetical protein LOC_Os12g19230 [Oryza sativa Japonica Group]
MEGLEGERQKGEGEGAGRRWRPWRCSPAHGAEWIPTADSGGEGVDGMARTTANATASIAQLGTAASGDRSGGGGGGEEGDGARALEGMGELGEIGKKREGVAVELK